MGCGVYINPKPYIGYIITAKVGQAPALAHGPTLLRVVSKRRFLQARHGVGRVPSFTLLLALRLV